MVGEKAALLDAFDAEREVLPLYTVELFLHRSPEKGVLCGAIVVYKMDLPENLKQLGEEPFSCGERVLRMEKFREPKWIEWALRRVEHIYYNELGQNARLRVKAPLLRIKQWIDAPGLVGGDLSRFDQVVKAIDKLLRNDFEWDPWSRTIRRGTPSATR